MSYLKWRPKGPGTEMPAKVATPSVLYVSAVAEMKGGAETVLTEMLRSPFVRPALAVPGLGALADFAAVHEIPVYLFDLGAVASVRRPARPADLARAGRDALRVARRVATIANECQADIVHANGLKVHVTGVLARLLYRSPTVLHMHDVPYSRAERLIWRALSAGAQHTIAASEICYSGMPQPARWSVVMQGVDMAPVTKSRQLPARPVLGFLGRFHPFKGVHLLIEWFEAIAGEFPTLTLLLRGRADAEGAAYWAGLRPRAERLVAAGRCRIEGWRGADADPFEDIDILIAPSATPEVGPRVIMEAMLRAIPAIGYPEGGARTMIPSPALGAHAADANGLRDALDRLLDPGRYAQVSAAALAHATTAFDIHRFWRDLRDAYDSTLRPVPERN
jgi:glycosyltransferase involved in cell wall biosynthesis